MEIKFTKVEGLGNDFILLDDRTGQIEKCMPYPQLARKLCSRHFGIGADGILLMLSPSDLDMKFHIYNSDGSQAQMCGNGIRCFAKHLYENGIVTRKRIRVETEAGKVVPEVILDGKGHVSAVRVDMGEPVLLCKDIPFDSDNETAIEEILRVEDQEYEVTMVSMGNPHAVIFVDNVDKVDVAGIGPSIETHKRFPEKTNVEFIEVENDTSLKMKVWERGAGITLACGTGACAALVAAHLTGRAQANANIHLDGGDLSLFWDKETNHIFKTGPATRVFEGAVRI